MKEQKMILDENFYGKQPTRNKKGKKVHKASYDDDDDDDDDFDYDEPYDPSDDWEDSFSHFRR